MNSIEKARKKKKALTQIIIPSCAELSSFVLEVESTFPSDAVERNVT